jgi:hypothetical protein
MDTTVTLRVTPYEMNLNLFFRVVYGVGLGISAFFSVQDDFGPFSALLDALDGRKVLWPTAVYSL